MDPVFLSRQQFAAATIFSATFFGLIGLFPALLPSSINANHRLKAANASSSPLTLKIMLLVVLLFIPVVLTYQIWAYRLFYHKTNKEDLTIEEAY